jgi:large subunit ribosomal protein L21
MSFAIVKQGSKCYKVSQGTVLDIELIDHELDKKFHFDSISFIYENGSVVANPSKEKITARVIDMVKGDKVVAFKKRRRKDSHRKVGHRQKYSRVIVESIQI